MSRKTPHQLIKENPFVLAPMDDVTDIGFRELAQDCGASFSTTELTSVDALVRDKVPFSRYQKGNLKHNAVQLFGSHPDVFTQAAEKVYDQADSIDVNFGCPSATVTKNCSGSMLLKDPKNVGAIVSKLVKHLDKPVTAKIRLGYKKMTYLDVAKEVEDAGAHLLTVHGRTAEQRYAGKANWDAIKDMYQELSIPLIGNGDVREEKDIDTYLSSHCDALMIGRAAIGNPMLFKQFSYYHKHKEVLDFDRKTVQKELFIKYLEKLSNYEIHKLNIKVQRQGMYFMKGIEGAKELRKKIMSLKDVDQIIEAVKEF